MVTWWRDSIGSLELIGRAPIDFLVSIGSLHPNNNDHGVTEKTKKMAEGHRNGKTDRDAVRPNLQPSCIDVLRTCLALL